MRGPFLSYSLSLSLTRIILFSQFLRMLYNIPQNATTLGQNSSLCVAEFQDDQAYMSSE